MFVPQKSGIMEGAKYSGGGPEWRVLTTTRQEVTFATYCVKSEAMNDAFRNNLLDHNLNVISQKVLQKLLMSLEIKILIIVPSIRNAKSLGK